MHEHERSQNATGGHEPRARPQRPHPPPRLANPLPPLPPPVRDALISSIAREPDRRTDLTPFETAPPTDSKAPPMSRPTLRADRFTDFAADPAAFATGFVSFLIVLLRFLVSLM